MDNKKSIVELYELYEEKMQPELKTQETSKLTREIIRRTNKINEELTPKQQKEIEDIAELRSERESICQEQVFIYAVSLILKILSEGLEKNIKIEKIVEN